MKKLILFALAALLVVPAADFPASAGAQTGAPARKGPKQAIKVVGELLDMGCWTSRGLRGELHRECATTCINAGVPMGVITADSTVYMLTQNHDRAMEPRSFAGTPDPYAQLKSMASKQVEILGLDWERNGYKYLEVKYAKLAPAAPGTPAKPGS